MGYPCKLQTRIYLVEFEFAFYRPLTDTGFLNSEVTVAVGQRNLAKLFGKYNAGYDGSGQCFAGDQGYSQ